MNTLDIELERDVELFLRMGRSNRRILYTLSLFAILSSFLASIAAAGDFLPKLWLAFVTAVPAATLLASNVFRFEAHANFGYKRARLAKHLLFGLRFEGRPPEEVSKELRKIESEMASEWPGLGSLAQETRADPSPIPKPPKQI
jgi:hypothetical protein